MRWQDVQQPPGRWAGLRFTLEDGPAKGRLRVEVAPRRLRLQLDGVPRLWARIDRDYSGLRWARAEGPCAVVPPIDFPTARSTRGLAAWARFFAQALQRAGALERGRWLLMPPWDPLAEPASHRGPPVYALAAVPGLPAQGRLDWGLNGSAEVLPLRPASGAEVGRVKAWRKGAEAGELPPVLLAWISGLDAHVVLDGHDRLYAANLSGAPVSALTLIREVPARWDRAGWQAEVEARYQRAEAQGARPPTLRALADQVASAHDPRGDLAWRTRAWALPGGSGAWAASVPPAHRAWLCG